MKQETTQKEETIIWDSRSNHNFHFNLISSYFIRHSLTMWFSKGGIVDISSESIDSRLLILGIHRTRSGGGRSFSLLSLRFEI